MSLLKIVFQMPPTLAKIFKSFNMDEGSNPVRSTRKLVFLSQKCCADSLSVCPTPVCIRTHKNDHVRTIKILQSMSEYGGLQKHEKTQHALKNNSSAGVSHHVVVTVLM